jgi:hypothetical protein
MWCGRGGVVVLCIVAQPLICESCHRRRRRRRIEFVRTRRVTAVVTGAEFEIGRRSGVGLSLACEQCSMVNKTF